VRILLVSDLHYTLKQLDWLVTTASDVDLVVVAGDLLDISSTVPLEAQIVVVLEYLTRIRATTPVVVGSGNHDLTGPDDNGEQAALWMPRVRALGVPTDGDSARFGDALVTVCPWWDGPIGREAVAAQLAADATEPADPWIWVYHWPPLGSPTCWTGKRDYGDGDLGGWIAEHRPTLVLTGHVHGPPFRRDGAWADRIGDTWVFNAGRQIGPVPAHVVLDLDEGTARWRSLAGVEELDLGAERAPARTAV